MEERPTAPTPPESVFMVDTRTSSKAKETPAKKEFKSWPKDRVTVEIPRRPPTPIAQPKKVSFNPDVLEDGSEDELSDQELEQAAKVLDEPEPVADKVDSTPPSEKLEKPKSYRRVSKLKELLNRNPQWKAMWKELLPEELLATNEIWQKDLLENLKAKNVKVTLQDKVDGDDLPVYDVFTIKETASTVLPVGSIVVQDPVEQFYNQTGYTGPYNIPRDSIAPENADLRTLWPIINRGSRKESLLDGGSQIASISWKAALELGLSYDPNFTITMESANKGRTKTLGLARNVPFEFDGISYYLQLHVLQDPAYDVLLGRPFEVVSQVSLQTSTGGDVSATIVEPGTGRKLTFPTYKRGQIPRHLANTEQAGFQRPSRT